MKLNHGLVMAFAFFLFACQPASSPTVTIVSDENIITFQSNERIPSALIAEARLTLNSNDSILSNGFPILLDRPIETDPIILQMRRAVTIKITMPEGEQQIQSSAFSVGDVLAEMAYPLQTNDTVIPSPNSPLEDGMTIRIMNSRVFTVNVDGRSMQIRSSARTVGEALAEAGIPLLGLDYSLPSEDEALPSDGQIKVVRVSESVVLAQKPIPFESELVAATDVPLDQTQILSPGENGLSVQRIRIRYEDGREISRTTEDETLVRPPKTRTLGYGTKVEVTAATVNGVQIEYWRAVQMYATSYSPCRLGTSTCGSTTASGKQLQKGVVALPTNLYQNMKGQPLYIPGYGFATVEDACGGCVGQTWIDLGYSDNDYKAWHSWVTVYFLTPVPQNIIYFLE